MAASKKDYVAIAKILREVAENDALAADAVRKIAQDLADHFGENNPNFDRSRWFRAVSA